MPTDTTLVFIRTTFEALHKWDAADGVIDYLKYPHRHLFHVQMEWEVTHEDRQIEFISMKQNVDRWIARLGESEHEPLLINWSCETYASKLGKVWGCTRVMVSEDGENGAIWIRNDK